MSPNHIFIYKFQGKVFTQKEKCWILEIYRGLITY